MPVVEAYVVLNEVEEPAPWHLLLLGGKIADAKALSSLSAPIRGEIRERQSSMSLHMTRDALNYDVVRR